MLQIDDFRCQEQAGPINPRCRAGTLRAATNHTTMMITNHGVLNDNAFALGVTHSGAFTWRAQALVYKLHMHDKEVRWLEGVEGCTKE